MIIHFTELRTAAMHNPFKKYLEAKQLEFGDMHYVCIFTDDAGVEEAAWVHNLGSKYEEDVATEGWPSSYHLLRLQQRESEKMLLCLKKLSKAVIGNDLISAQDAQKELTEVIKGYGSAGLIDWLVGDIFMSGRMST